MSLINKNSFLNLINENTSEYIGMGNPNSDLLLVGSEKAFDVNLQPLIAHHELYHNYMHWKDLVCNHNHLENSYDDLLLNRPHPLDGFNPFNPLFLDDTRQIVMPLGGHTYKKIKRLVNHFQNIHHLPETDINPIDAPGNNFDLNTFSKCFITDLSSMPAINQNQANFQLDEFLQSERYNFLSHHASSFYQDFKTTILYFGNNTNYIGLVNSPQRLSILRIFNPNIEHTDRQMINSEGFNFECYIPNTGSKIVLSYHFTAFGIFTANYSIALASLI
jgi:hypothetical protein